MSFVSIPELAALAGISRQAMQKAVVNSIGKGQKKWRGIALSVVTRTAQGGNSGKQYLVAVDSLPLDLQEAYNIAQNPVEEPSKPIHTDGVAQKTRWFVEVFADVLAAPKGSQTRGAEIRALVGKTVIDWKGSPRKISKKLAYTWLQKYERDGMAGLARKQNSSIGKKRVHFSRKFDDFMRKHGVGEQQIQLIAESAHEYIAGLTLEGKKPKIMRALGREHLMKLARLAGVTKPTDLALKAVCAVERNYFGRDENRMHRKVFTYYKNRKVSYDRQPRIQRKNPDRPMEVVVMDVHHVNVLVSRPDGTTATPKCLAIMDLATQRVWCDFVLPEKGGGIRQEHIAYSTAYMFEHPQWGVPEAIHIDNGSEYKFMDVLEDALQLNSRSLLAGRRNLVIKALPRNAASKPIEGWFGRFEQGHLRGCQGYIGDDRMKPEVETLDKLPAPFGTFEQFVAYAFRQLEAYEFLPQGGQLNGKSPHEFLQHHFNNGWSATVADALEILSIITTPMPRIVRKGTVMHGNVAFFADALCDARWDGERVLLHVPKAMDFDALRVTDLKNNDICIAYRDEAYGYLNQDGARESNRRKSQYYASFKRIRKDIPPTDAAKDLEAFVENEKRRSPMIANEPAARLSVNPLAREAGSALIHSKEPVDLEAELRKKEKIKAEQEKIWLQLEENWKASDV